MIFFSLIFLCVACKLLLHTSPCGPMAIQFKRLHYAIRRIRARTKLSRLVLYIVHIQYPSEYIQSSVRMHVIPFFIETSRRRGKKCEKSKIKGSRWLLYPLLSYSLFDEQLQSSKSFKYSNLYTIFCTYPNPSYSFCYLAVFSLHVTTHIDHYFKIGSKTFQTHFYVVPCTKSKRMKKETVTVF